MATVLFNYDLEVIIYYSSSSGNAEVLLYKILYFQVYKFKTIMAPYHVKVIKAPVLKFLTEILNTDPGCQMKLVCPVQAQHGVKVAWGPE